MIQTYNYHNLSYFHLYNIMSLTVSVDFGGGLDLVFDGKTELKLELP